MTFPPLPVSLAAGLAIVGSSPVLLLSSFLATLAIWAGYSVYGTFIAPSAATLVIIQALPPLHSILDVSFVVAGHPTNILVGLAAAVVLVLFRAALQSFWIAFMAESFRPRSRVEPASWQDRTRDAVLRARRSFRVMVTIEALFLALAVVSLFLLPALLGPSIGGIVEIAALVGGIYFLVFAPVVAVLDGAEARSAVTLSARAARIPGPRHLLLAFAYLAVTLFVQQVPNGLSRTPGIGVWAFALFMTFFHLAVQGAFVHRWLIVGEPVTSTFRDEARDRPSRTRG